MILRFLVLSHYQRVTDGQTEEWSDTPPIANIAERDDADYNKKKSEMFSP